MLSCLGLYSMSYWYIDNATTATEISCSSIQPCSHHPSNLSSTHDYPQPKSLLWCYIIPDTHCLSGQLWNIAYTPDKPYSNSGVFHYYSHTVNTSLNHVAILTLPLFPRTGLTPFCWEAETETPCANVNAMIKSEKHIKENDCFLLTWGVQSLRCLREKMRMLGELWASTRNRSHNMKLFIINITVIVIISPQQHASNIRGLLGFCKKKKTWSQWKSPLYYWQDRSNMFHFLLADINAVGNSCLSRLV